MCSTYASLTPEFYLHHGFLDKIWHTWQQHSTACLKARFSKLREKMTRFRCAHSQKDLLDSGNLPGCVRVVYTDYYYAAREKATHDQGKQLGSNSNDALEDREQQSDDEQVSENSQRKHEFQEGGEISHDQRIFPEVDVSDISRSEEYETASKDEEEGRKNGHVEDPSSDDGSQQKRDLEEDENDENSLATVDELSELKRTSKDESNASSIPRLIPRSIPRLIPRSMPRAYQQFEHEDLMAME